MNVPQHLRDRYLVETNGQYMIDPVLRQKIIFSVHNLISDPPFMNLDLISCRNLLIYLKEEPQASVISMFIFGLRRGAYLFLGSSESVGKFKPAFEVINPRWRIFRKTTNEASLGRSMFATRKNTGQALEVVNGPAPAPAVPRKAFYSEVSEVRSRDTLIRSYDALRKRYAPSSILMTVDG